MPVVTHWNCRKCNKHIRTERDDNGDRSPVVHVGRVSTELCWVCEGFERDRRMAGALTLCGDDELAGAVSLSPEP